MIALYIWIITVFSDVPQKHLILRCCLIHLKNSSIYILTYDTDNQCRKSKYRINRVTQKTKYYLGDCEEVTDNLGNIKKIDYLSGGAILIITNRIETMYYGYSDYQGKLIALANEGGTVVERYAYYPWGKSRIV